MPLMVCNLHRVLERNSERDWIQRLFQRQWHQENVFTDATASAKRKPAYSAELQTDLNTSTEKSTMM